MKFEWIEEGDGCYRVQFFDMDEKKVFDIKITDYSDPYWQQSDLERKIRRECCYDVIFYAGHRKSYSDNPNYETEYGFQGKSEHDIIPNCIVYAALYSVWGLPDTNGFWNSH